MRGHTENATFVRRFDEVRRAVVRMQIVKGICYGILVVGTALVALAAADYLWEWPWNARAAGLAVGLGLAAIVSVVCVLRSVLWWNRPRTAQELEAHFPQLGQSVRTVVQFSGRDPQAISKEGVMPKLVTALEDETSRQVDPLDLSKLVPRRRAIAAGVVALFPFVLLLAGLLLDWEWRLAVSRALLGNAPYTTIAVQPGDVTVDQGDEVTLKLTLHGRVDRRVSLVTRNPDTPKADSTARELDAEASGRRSSDGRSVEYSVAMKEVVDPFDYRFLAGRLETGTHQVSVRYPLALTKFEATLTPPSYTGLRPTTVEGGDLRVIEDSRIEFVLEFDRECREAYLRVSDPPYREKKSGKSASAVRVDLQPSQDGLIATLRYRDEKLYSIVASATEGGPLPENEYSIRIRKDRAPQVRFEDPPEAWEVNPIAEVPMKIRVDDDFGVSKAGIIFQIDNGEEHKLVTKEFSTSVGPDANGEIQLTTRDALEELLCLEDFPVTETSAVTYYAYVEDNYPKTPRQTVTDLRFIEIRPFERFFRQAGSCNCQGGQCMTLEELIARQRHMLNRTTRVVRNRDAGRPDQATLDEMIEFETTLADLTLSLAEGLESCAGVHLDCLFEAEEAMRTSIDRLREMDFPLSAEYQAEALALLIQARSAMRLVLGDTNSGAGAAAQKFDREQMQKLRKLLGEDEKAAVLVAELEKLAEEERFVYETLGGAPREDPANRRELQQRQHEIVLDAYGVQKLMESTEGMTELAEGRMSESIGQAERASDALLQGDTEAARETAGEASRLLKELARHVAGLAARDLAEKIGAARDLSAEMAEQQRDLADQFGQDQPPGSQSPQGSTKSGSADGAAGDGRGDLPGRVDRVAEAGRTLEDLLDALTRDGEVEGEIAADLAALRETADLEKLLRQIEALQRDLRDSQAGNLHVDARDVAERLEVLAGALDALHRTVVTPRLAELLELEAKVASLREQLERLTTETEITQWHLEAQRLIESLERTETGTAAAEALRLAMEEAGWGTDRADWGWDHGFDASLNLSRYYAPVLYGRNLIVLGESLQQEARELLLRDMISSSDDAVPPDYEELVERYFEVLSRERNVE